MTSSSQFGQFHSTRWSLIAQAQVGSTVGRAALEELCNTYWFPIYEYIRRRGQQPDDARDLTQELFASILSRDGFARATPDKGRFRSYILTAAKNLISEQFRNRQTTKRGGQVRLWSIDCATAEQRMQWEPLDQQTPERIFEMRWAKQILTDAFAQLDALNAEPTRREYYLKLRSFIAIDSDTVPYAEVAQELQASETALRVQVHRLRKKFRELLRQSVAETLVDPGEIDDELSYLLSCLRA